jgi:hypothetical protein
MEHRSLDTLRNTAEVLPNWLNARPLSRSERLRLWAAALEREGSRQLNTLFEIEYQPRAKRAALRADDSLLSIAYADPRLRAEGLAGDTVGDALAFFSISERELHDIACFCHYGPTMAANVAAAQIRALATSRPAEMRAFVVGTFAAATIAIGLLML